MKKNRMDDWSPFEARSARFSVAPMMDWTDRHCRFFHRLMSRETLLYTEMITSAALVKGDATHLLRFDPKEQPLALQLGGSDPDELALAAEIGETHGYREINLNVGCPSDRVQSGAFGAVLMKSPALVADCIEAMSARVQIPITVKCRIGVDEQIEEETLPDFIERVSAAGINRMTIHARKAWLKGLSPKENREIPPLNYDLVQEMKSLFPRMHISVNGGVQSLSDANGLLDQGFDGVMIGRAAYHNPWDLLGRVDSLIFGSVDPFETPHEVVEAMVPYIDAHVADGGRLHSISRHMLGLFSGIPGARSWRRALSENAHNNGATSRVLLDAMEHVSVAKVA